MKASLRFNQTTKIGTVIQNSEKRNAVLDTHHWIEIQSVQEECLTNSVFALPSNPQATSILFMSS